MVAKILVSGATGNVGAEIVQLLAAQGAPVRTASTDAAQLQTQWGDAVEAMTFDFTNPATFGPTFAGVERMFLLRPPTMADVQQAIVPALAAAQEAGVRYVVFLSQNFVLAHSIDAPVPLVVDCIVNMEQ